MKKRNIGFLFTILLKKDIIELLEENPLEEKTILEHSYQKKKYGIFVKNMQKELLGVKQ
jgi:hypothetical protein